MVTRRGRTGSATMRMEFDSQAARKLPPVATAQRKSSTIRSIEASGSATIIPSGVERAREVELSESAEAQVATQTQRFLFGLPRSYLLTSFLGISLGVLATFAALFLVKPEVPTGEAAKVATVSVGTASSVVQAPAAVPVEEVVVPVKEVVSEEVAQEKPSITDALATERPVQVGRGEVTYMANSQRLYSPDYISTDKKGILDVGSNKTITATRNAESWQSGFKIDSPAYNVKLGSAHTSYLDDQLGQGRDGLSSFKPRKADMLSNTSSTSNGLSSVKKY